MKGKKLEKIHVQMKICSPFPLLFVPGISFTLYLSLTVEEAQYNQVTCSSSQNLLVAQNSRVGGTDRNSKEKHIIRERRPSQRVQQQRRGVLQGKWSAKVGCKLSVMHSTVL